MGLNLERITKRFYHQFRKEHAALRECTTGITEGGDREWYASVMLNRLIFVYFMQRKGFLDGDRDYLRNRLARCRKEKGYDECNSFYRCFLLPLFHEGLGGRKRGPDLERRIGRVPYVNGSMFDIHELERPERYGKTVQIPDAAFDRVFDYFDQYQWRLDERPLRADNEINPDVLGCVFERYINQKQMGAYYTKDDVTEYISTNTVLPFLLDAVRMKCKVAFENPGGPTVWDLLCRDPDRYIHDAMLKGLDKPLPSDIAAGIETVAKRDRWNKSTQTEYALATEIWRETLARRERCGDLRKRLAAGEVRNVNDLITLNLDIRQFAQDVIEHCKDPELLRAFWHAVERITILDPTCGSGAFLFAALSVLAPLYEACLDRMGAFVADSAGPATTRHSEELADFRSVLRRAALHPNRRYFIRRSIITNNLFGVDIMDEAVDICKLILFLKLVSQIEPDPNIANFVLEPLLDIDFNIRAGNTLIGYVRYDDVQRSGSRKCHFEDTKADIAARATDLRPTFDVLRRRQVKGDGSMPMEGKPDFRRRLDELEEKFDQLIAREYGIKATDTPLYRKWISSHRPFHWFFEFYDIMDSGGFDVIIGNPPYVEYRRVRDFYRIRIEQYTSAAADNLYAYCMETSCRLLKPTGRFGMIVPVAVLGLTETQSLRDVLLKRYSENWCSTYAVRPAKLFDGVDQRLCVYLGAGPENDRPDIWSTRYHHWNIDERPALFSSILYTKSFVHRSLKRIPQIGSNLADSVLQKIDKKSSKVVRFYYASGKEGFLLHYHRSPRYWIRAMDFEQYFESQTRSRSIHHFRDLYFVDKRYGKFIGALINSTLFFFWFISIGNGRNVTGSDIEQLPVGAATDELLERSGVLFDLLMHDYRRNSFVREREDCKFQEFRPNLSKPIIDEIDMVAARHYAFSDEELDFIINYDVKYRAGRGTSDHYANIAQGRA